MLSFLAFLALLAAGCGTLVETSVNNSASDTTVSEMGYVKFLVTDAPPNQTVTSIMLTVSGVSVHMADNDEASAAPPVTTAAITTVTTNTTITTTPAATGLPADDSDWITIPISGANPFDLLKLQGIDEVLGSSSLKVGRYTQIRLNIDKAQVSLGGGALQDATVPSGEVKFVTPFDIIAGVTTDIKLDFDAQKSVNVTGNDKVMFKPVIKLAISNENTTKLASVNGTVSAVSISASSISILGAGAAQPIVLNINPQTVIVLNETQSTLSAISALPAGSTATVSYYSINLKAVRVEVVTPVAATATTATV